MTVDPTALVKGIADAFVETIADVHPEPAPSGIIYAAYMQAGGGITSYQAIMDALVTCGRLKKSSTAHCYELGEVELKKRGL